MTLSGKNIVLGVSGSIAAYKAAELVRQLRKEGANVFVVMSPHAKDFISPLTMQSLSGNPVTSDLFNPEQEEAMGHIRLADLADVVVVAPATANTLAKAVSGFADDVLSAVLLATKAPVIFAPSMNVQMWENEITKQNVSKLKTHGGIFVGPEHGELACGWIGEGRFASGEAIVSAIADLFQPQDLFDVDVLVTAGPTREFIDPIRFLSNTSSGKMGYAISQAASERGARVTLISGPTELLPPTRVETHFIETALQLEETLHAQISRQERKHRLLFMAAAVADHRAERVSQEKLSFDKTKERSLSLVPNSDILRGLGEKREREGLNVKLVGFCAESGDRESLLKKAQEKLNRKKVDLIVANLIEDSFGKDENHVFVVWNDGFQEIQRAPKLQVAREIISVSKERLLAKK